MMRTKHILEALAAATMMVALSACTSGSTGGGGDSLGGTIPVSDKPQYADGTKLADAPDGTEFPLLQAQGYHSNSGGSVPDEPGERKASVTPLADDGMRLKVRNFLDVQFSDAHREVDEDGVVTYAKNVDGRPVVLQLYGALAGLDYMELGAWAVTNNNTSHVGFGVGVGGYETHPDDVPTSGSARYEGKMVGVSVNKNTGDAYDLIGDAWMEADFTTGGGSIEGGFTGTTATNIDTKDSSVWNDVTFNGSITSNGFSGTTAVTATNTNPGGLTSGADGTIAGKFFGPGADEAGGAWTLEDSSTVATGAFGGVEQP